MAEKEEKTEGAKKEEGKTKKTEAEKKPEEQKNARTYVIPLRGAFRGLRTRRAKRASRIVVEFIKKHSKTDEPKIDPSVIQFIHSRGKANIPRSVKVTASKEGDKTTVKLAG